MKGLMRFFLLIGALVASEAAEGQRLKGVDIADFRTIQPKSPNPYVSYLPPGVEPDYEYWDARMKLESVARDRGRSVSRVPTHMQETEPNDTEETASFVEEFGFGGSQDSEVDVTGSIGPSGTSLSTAAEDNGAISLATDLGAIASGTAVVTSSYLGDGPHGSGGTQSGDFDFFKVEALQSGDVLTIDVSTLYEGFAGLDSFVTLYNSVGAVVASNDDEDYPVNLDSFIQHTVTSSGTYYVAVGSYGSNAPSDPFDSGSGPGFFTEGDYDLLIGVDLSLENDVDYYSFDLTAGDVFALSGQRAQAAYLIDPAGELLIGSGQDASSIYPAESPLPGGTGIALAYVASDAGRYTLLVDANPGLTYTVGLRLFRPGLEASAQGSRQILFVDFDGASVNTSIFGFDDTTVELSPLADFLPAWGLQASDEDAVIDAIMASVEESLLTDVAGAANPRFALELRNSRDHADPFGQPNVSRLIVGGTIDESGLDTIGLAQSIDPGNFATGETALILLDVLSGPPSGASLNEFAIAEGSTKIDLIGVGVGNVAAHEAGHYLGNFHTDQFYTAPNLMDQGGNFPNTLGVGVDNIFGSPDDIDVDLGIDQFSFFEGFLGFEDTLNVTAFGLTSPEVGPSMVYVNFSAGVNGVGTLANPFNSLSSALAAVADDGTVRIFPGSTVATFSGLGAIERTVQFVNHNPGGGIVRLGAP